MTGPGVIDATRMRRAAFLDAGRFGDRAYLVSGGTSAHVVNLYAIDPCDSEDWRGPPDGNT